MQVRLWNVQQDYSILVKWWTDWKFGTVPKECLPPDGIIVEDEGKPVCAGGLYIGVGTQFAFMEWIVADKSANKRDIHKALRMCIDAIIELAKKAAKEPWEIKEENDEIKNLPSSTRGLFGTDYSVLHPDFAYYHNQSRNFGTCLQSVLISMGATDPKNLTLPLTSFVLQEKHNLKLTVLIGHNPNITPELNQLSNQSKLLDVLGPVPNMAQILWDHDIVICSGGVTLHEAISVGTPAFVINQVEHQQTKARFAEKSGAAINLGMGNRHDEEKFREALDFKKPKLELMSLKAKQLIDGRGIFRVIDAMSKLTTV